jgi:hypothetical protein
MENLAERSNRESEDQETQSPIAGGVGDEFDGVGAEIGVYGAPNEQAERKEAKNEHKNFHPFARQDCVHAAALTQ